MKLNKKTTTFLAFYTAFIILLNFGVLHVHAAGDPIAVVNNLSDFIFSLIRAIGMILLGFGVVQIGLSLKSHDPSQRANVRPVGALNK